MPISDTYKKCKTLDEIISEGGQLVENQDGTVSVYVLDIFGGLKPSILSQECCLKLNPSYSYDIDKQQCRWSKKFICDIENPFKLVLNPEGNDGAIFNATDNESCSLTIEFDYLIKVKCDTLFDMLIGSTNFGGPSGVSQSQNENAALIDNLISDIQNQIIICDFISNQIANVQEQINLTQYSIICDFVPNPVSPNMNFSKENFENTGFGSGMKDLPPANNFDSVGGQIYCLTEPYGINAWANILGPINYQNFLNGDLTSYDCNDVQQLFNLNTGSTIPLIVPCDTPINTKFDLITQLNTLLAEQNDCLATLNSLYVALNNLQLTGATDTIKCNRPIDMFETLDLSVSVEALLSGTTLTSVYEATDFFPPIGVGNLYTYLTNNPNSGFYLCSGSDCSPIELNPSQSSGLNGYSCDTVISSLINDLYSESGLSGETNGEAVFYSTLASSALTSNWVHYTLNITDKAVIDQILGKKIKLSLNINHTCGNICLLLDNIRLNKQCSAVTRTDIFITQSPGFDLERVVDNKKSWKNNSTLTNRVFSITNTGETNTIRQTNYNVDDERLILNSKEIDLDINMASAIETDVWCYVLNNSCLLTGDTTCDVCLYKTFQDGESFEFMDGARYEFSNEESYCCGDNQIDFDLLLTEPISATTTIDEFKAIITSELIDAKNRKTLSSYPTLRALYDRYLNSYVYCGTNSSAFNYITMDRFANLLGDYWVDLVEQVIPATTIWGGVKILTNTIFDQQKFQYKAYSMLLCDNPFENDSVSSPINGINGISASIETKIENVPLDKNTDLNGKRGVITTCDTLYLAQMNFGSEFIGTVKIIGDKGVV